MAVVKVDQLPNDVAASTPSVLRWERGGEIMRLPLRDAREVFEREYLIVFEHDPQVAAGYIRENAAGKRYVEPVL